jgi:hypothetical protein
MQPRRHPHLTQTLHCLTARMLIVEGSCVETRLKLVKS